MDGIFAERGGRHCNGGGDRCVSRNTAGITTPIAIGYLVKGTGSFNAALVFVAANALIAVGCYALVVGKIKRFELRK